MKALATTGMKEYWTKALSQFQNSHSSVGTMKKGMKRGPSSAQTAEAIMPKEMTKRTALQREAVLENAKHQRSHQKRDVQQAQLAASSRIWCILVQDGVT